MRWKSLDRFLKGAVKLRATLQKVGAHQFELRVELVAPGKHFFVRVVADTITELVDKVNKRLKRQIISKKE